MRKLGIVLAVMAVGACSFVTIADRYGNQYGDWYNPGNNFTWQLDLCQKQMDAQSVPAMGRKLAMRCCMRDHGVPVSSTFGCSA